MRGSSASTCAANCAGGSCRSSFIHLKAGRSPRAHGGAVRLIKPNFIDIDVEWSLRAVGAEFKVERAPAGKGFGRVIHAAGRRMGCQIESGTKVSAGEGRVGSGGTMRTWKTRLIPRT